MELNRLTEFAAPPSGFLCSLSKEVMDNPVYNLCGHVFDERAFRPGIKCPHDQQPLDIVTCVPFHNLKERIFSWKLEQGLEKGQLQLVSENVRSIENGLSSIQLAEPSLEPITSIVNAHADDIHAMISSRKGFITGSKDTTITMWTSDGKHIRTLDPNQGKGYKSWVTAMRRFSNDYWAYGTRDGKLVVLDQKGNEIRSMLYSPPSKVQEAYKCKERNKTRINCITELFSDKTTTQFYVGTPQYVHLFDGKSSKILKSYFAHKNDWVYCLEPLTENRLAVVYGSTLQVWDTRPDKKLDRTNLVKATYSHGQREHISSITKLTSQNSLACAVFDGTVRVVDISEAKTQCHFDEHKGRVWSVLEIDHNILVSSADDSLIKIWDLRGKNSIHSIKGGNGRVSTLLRLGDNILLSGSCPDNPYASTEKATISFWDLRTLSQM
jgi:WD40 repeat protein